MCNKIHRWRHFTRLTIFPELFLILPKCVLCKATISCMTLPPKNVSRHVKIPELENKYFKKTVWRHKWRHRGCKNTKKYFLNSFYHCRMFFFLIMYIGSLKKNYRGWVKIDPSRQPLNKKDLGRRGVHIRRSLSPPTAANWPSGDSIHFIGWRCRDEI